MLGPRLDGTVISLQPARLEDAPLRMRWFADMDVTRHYCAPGAPSLQQDESSFNRTARDQAVFLWRIDLGGQTIGQASLHAIDWFHRQARSALMIGDREQWGKGYGSEVVRLRTAFALGELGLERIETCSITANIGMHRALERSGFRKIGRRTRSSFYGGVWHDEFIFELLRDDWLRWRDGHGDVPAAPER